MFLVPSLWVARLFSSLAVLGASSFLLRAIVLSKTYTTSMILTCPVRFHIGKYQSNLRSRVKLSFEREMYSHNDRHMIEGTSCDNNRTIMWDTWQRCRWIQKYKTILKTQRGCSSRTGSPQWRYIEKKRFRELKSENPPRYNNSHRFIRIKLHLVWLEACPIKRSIVDCNLPGNGPDSYFFFTCAYAENFTLRFYVITTIF